MSRRGPKSPTRARIAAELDFLVPTGQATALDGEALEVADLFSRLPSRQRRFILAALRLPASERDAVLRNIERPTHGTPTQPPERRQRGR